VYTIWKKCPNPDCGAKSLLYFPTWQRTTLVLCTVCDRLYQVDEFLKKAIRIGTGTPGPY